MREIDSLKFVREVVLREDGTLEESAYYDYTADVIGLVDDNIETVVHELCERDTLELVGYHPIQSTSVSHIMSPLKGGHWGKWRTFGQKP